MHPRTIWQDFLNYKNAIIYHHKGAKFSAHLIVPCFIGCLVKLVRLGPVVQWLERAAHNGVVVGSNPARPTIFPSQEIPGRPKILKIASK